MLSGLFQKIKIREIYVRLSQSYIFSVLKEEVLFKDFNYNY